MQRVEKEVPEDTAGRFQFISIIGRLDSKKIGDTYTISEILVNSLNLLTFVRMLKENDSAVMIREGW